jgi:hypothetical protein
VRRTGAEPRGPCRLPQSSGPQRSRDAHAHGVVQFTVLLQGTDVVYYLHLRALKILAQRTSRFRQMFLFFLPFEPGSLKRSTGTSDTLTVEPHSILDRLLPSVGPQIRPQFCHEHTTGTLVRPLFRITLHLDRPPDLHASTVHPSSVP